MFALEMKIQREQRKDFVFGRLEIATSNGKKGEPNRLLYLKIKKKSLNDRSMSK